MLRKLVLSISLVVVPVVAIAQTQTERERGDKACRGDVRRLCKAVIEQGDLAVLHCLQTNRTKLNGTCTKFLKEVGQL